MIVPSVIENVFWGWHTIVDAQLSCYQELLKARTRYPWKYVINLCGKEAPLRTNREMVDSLSKLNGTSAIRKIKAPEFDIYRFEARYILKNGSVVKTNKKPGNIPYNLTMHKHSAYVALTEPFINFLLHNKTAITFRKFMDETLIPDEHYISTLFAVPGKIILYAL